MGYGFNPCGSRLFQRDVGEQWLQVNEGRRICSQELAQPGQTWTGRLDLPHNALSGRYRLLIRLRPLDITEPSQVAHVSPIASPRTSDASSDVNVASWDLHVASSAVDDVSSSPSDAPLILTARTHRHV